MAIWTGNKQGASGWFLCRDKKRIKEIKTTHNMIEFCGQ